MQTNVLIAVLLVVGFTAPAVACLGWFWYAKRVQNGFAEGQWIARVNRDRAQNNLDAERGHIKGSIWIPRYTRGGWCRPRASDSIPLTAPQYVHVRDQHKFRPNSDQHLEGPRQPVSSPPPRPPKTQNQLPGPLSKRQQKKQRAQKRKKQQQAGHNQSNQQNHNKYKGKGSQQGPDKPTRDCNVMPDQGHWGINKPDDWDNKDATQSQNKGNRLHRDQDKTTKDWNAEPNNENWYYNNQNDWDKRNDNDNNNDYNDNQKSDWGHEAKGRARSNRSQGNSNKDHGDRRSRRGSPRHKVNHNSHNDGNHSGSICNNGFVNKVQMHQTSSWVHAQSEPNNPGFHPTSVRSDQCEGRWPNKSPNSGTHHGNKHRDSCNGYHNGPQRQSSRNRLNNTWGNEPSHKQRSQQASGWGQSNQGNDWDKYENQLKHSQAGWDENQQGGMEDWGGGSHHNHNQEWSQDVEKGRTHEPMGW